MLVCLSVDKFCQHYRLTSIQDAVTDIYRCVVEIQIKAEFKDECGLTHMVLITVYSSSNPDYFVKKTQLFRSYSIAVHPLIIYFKY